MVQFGLKKPILVHSCPPTVLWPFLIQEFSSKTKGPGEEGAARNHPEISSHKKLISSADFPMTPMERTEHHFGPFCQKDFGAISGGPLFSQPLCFTAEESSRTISASRASKSSCFGNHMQDQTNGQKPLAPKLLADGTSQLLHTSMTLTFSSA